VRHYPSVRLTVTLNKSAKKTAVTTAAFPFGDASTLRNQRAVTPEPATLPQAQQHRLNPLRHQPRRLLPRAWKA